MSVVKLQHHCQILAGSVQSVQSNLGGYNFQWGDVSDEDAR